MNFGLQAKTAPIIFDAIKPDSFEVENSTLLLHSFIGATPAICMIELLSQYALEKVLFFGSCSRLITEEISKDQKEDKEEVIFSNTFHTYNSKYLKKVADLSSLVNSTSNNRWADQSSEISSASIGLPTYLRMNELEILYEKSHVTYVDMESAFIAESCNAKGINYYAALACTDNTHLGFNDDNSLKKLSQITDFSSIFHKIHTELLN